MIEFHWVAMNRRLTYDLAPAMGTMQCPALNLHQIQLPGQEWITADPGPGAWAP